MVSFDKGSYLSRNLMIHCMECLASWTIAFVGEKSDGRVFISYSGYVSDLELRENVEREVRARCQN